MQNLRNDEIQSLKNEVDILQMKNKEWKKILEDLMDSLEWYQYSNTAVLSGIEDAYNIVSFLVQDINYEIEKIDRVKAYQKRKNDEEQQK